MGPDAVRKHNEYANSEGQYHGTAMLSLVAGKEVGVARRAGPILVGLPKCFTPESYLNGIGKINDDLGSQMQTQAKAVVLLAHYYLPAQLSSADYRRWLNGFHTFLPEMASKGAVLVTGAGNIEPPGQLNGWPSKLGKNTSDLTLPSLIVVGALTPNARGRPFVTDLAGGIPHIYAPGMRIRVAEGDSTIDNPFRSAGGEFDCKYKEITFSLCLIP